MCHLVIEKKSCISCVKKFGRVGLIRLEAKFVYCVTGETVESGDFPTVGRCGEDVVLTKVKEFITCEDCDPKSD